MYTIKKKNLRTEDPFGVSADMGKDMAFSSSVTSTYI